MEVFLDRCTGVTVYGEVPSTFAVGRRTTHWGPFDEGHTPCPCVHALSEHGSKFILMLIKIKLAVHFVGSKGCFCSLGGEAHLVNFHRALARAITLSSFVSSLDRFYSVLIPPGPCCHNFIGFMAAAELPCAIV